MYRGRKILVRRVADELIAAFDSDGHIVLHTLYCCLPRKSGCDPLFLTGLINSSLLSYWFKRTFVLTDKLFPYIRKSQLELLPISARGIEDAKAQRGIAKSVDRILAAKRKNPAADTGRVGARD